MSEDDLNLKVQEVTDLDGCIFRKRDGRLRPLGLRMRA